MSVFIRFDPVPATITIGQSVSIKWTSENWFNRIRIGVSYNQGSSYQELKETSLSSSSYTHTPDRLGEVWYGYNCIDNEYPSEGWQGWNHQHTIMVKPVNSSPSIPGTINFPTQINGGSSITVSWTASTDSDGNLSGYKVERSINGGSSWTQIYQGSSTSCTDRITFGWPTVQYRVKAYDEYNAESGWRTSVQRNVINNTAPSKPASITVPLQVIGGKSLLISWTACKDSENNLSSYRLQRQIAGGTWTQVYQGTGLTYQDTITKGWANVAYRVKAYDSGGLESAYETSQARTIDNNTAPAITCSSSGDLGEKASGFSISYTVDDADGDTVTVTEKMDSAVKRTFTPTLGAANSFAVTDSYFMELLNGQHAMDVTVADAGGKSSSLNLTFTKAVHALRITLAHPMEADALITKTVLNITRSIPDDAEFKVLVSNNAKDDSPVWEDATNSVKTGLNYLFQNTTVSKGHAYNFIITASRGSSGAGGFISSIGGAFE